MRQLHVLGVSDEGDTLLLGTTANGKITHRLPLDGRLRQAVRGQLTAPGSDRVESVLSPKEIQARLRAGATPDEVAKVAGVPVARVLPYFAPVEAERERIVEEARRAVLHRTRAPLASQPLGEAVDARLREVAGLKEDSVAWTARRRADGDWVVRLTYIARGGKRTAEWVWQPANRALSALDSSGTRLAAEAVAPKRKSVRRPAAKKASGRTSVGAARKATARGKGAARGKAGGAKVAAKRKAARTSAPAARPATAKKTTATRATSMRTATPTRASATRASATAKRTSTRATATRIATAKKATATRIATAKKATATKAAAAKRAATKDASAKRAATKVAATKATRLAASKAGPTKKTTSATTKRATTIKRAAAATHSVTRRPKVVSAPAARGRVLEVVPDPTPAEHLAPAVVVPAAFVSPPQPAASEPAPTPVAPAPARRPGVRVPVPSWSDVLLGVTGPPAATRDDDPDDNEAAPRTSSGGRRRRT